MGLDMERRESMGFMSSDWEDQDEDHMKRISMSFSIDVSERLRKQNRSHNFNQILATERRCRNPGGGLFGKVEGKNHQRSNLSFTVPNRFYADSRDFCHEVDDYNQQRKPTEIHRRCPMPYDCDYVDSERYGPDRYQRYSTGKHNSIDLRQNPTEYYDYPRPLKYHRSQRNYISPRYEKYMERPRREKYHQSGSYDREYCPEFVFKKIRRRHEVVSDEHFNGDFPRKLINRPRCDEITYYGPSNFSELPENLHRKKSGFSGSEYQSNYVLHPRPTPDSFHHNDQPTLRPYDCRYEGSQMCKSAPVRKKSVEFFHYDCEIPYNILKRHRNIADHQPYHRVSPVDIPYRKIRRHKRNSDFRHESELQSELTLQPKRTASGNDIPQRRRRQSHSHNHVTRSCKMQRENVVCCKKSNKSLKRKISDFFKRSKCKSRTRCCRIPRETRNSISSNSFVMPQRKYPCCKPKIYRTKCIAYPTVYRDKCPCSDDPCIPTKVNCSQLNCEPSNFCCCESCRQCEASSGPPIQQSKLNVDAPSYCSFPTEDPTSCCCASLDKLDAACNKRSPRIISYSTPCAPTQECPGKICSRSSCSTEDLSCPWKTCCSSAYATHTECPGKSAPKKKYCTQSCKPEENVTRCPSSCELPVRLQFSDNPKNDACPARTCPFPCGSQIDCPRKFKTPCCCASCVNELVLNQIKKSTVNVCLKIRTADGTMLEPSRITTTVDKDEIPSKMSRPYTSGNILALTASCTTLSSSCKNKNTICKKTSLCTNESSTSSKYSCKNVLSVIRVNAKKNDCDSANVGSSLCCCNTNSLPSKKVSDASTICSRNNFINPCTRRSSSLTQRNITYLDPKVPKPILTTGKKCCSQSCLKCPEKARTSCNCGQKLVCSTSTEICCKRVECAPTKKNCPERVVKCCELRAKNCPATKTCCTMADDGKCCTNRCKKCTPKVEFDCTPFVACSKQCENRPSYVEELKKELLDSLRSEQEQNCQPPCQRPTPHIMICPQEMNAQPCWKLL